MKKLLIIISLIIANISIANASDNCRYEKDMKGNKFYTCSDEKYMKNYSIKNPGSSNDKLTIDAVYIESDYTIVEVSVVSNYNLLVQCRGIKNGKVVGSDQKYFATTGWHKLWIPVVSDSVKCQARRH